jgi:ATPase subunit of ABC transporter with duplicated ATPase domains
MAYGQKLLFFDVNLILSAGQHYALVGANGAGKSTFFKLFTGEEEPAAGQISIPKDLSVGWLKQDQFFYENTLITDILLQGKKELWQALQAKEELLQTTTDWDEKIAGKLSQLEETIMRQDGYAAEALAEKLLTGLGIPAEYHHKPLKSLSGGYKLRVLLAQALFQNPDILLLDEPTNHLDIISIAWLEKYLLSSFKGTLIFISHDVSFINRLADKILDIDYAEIREYSGQYVKFLAEKHLIAEQKLQERQYLEQKIAAMQGLVDRFRAGTRAKQAQSRVKMIEKITVPDVKNSSRAWPNFSFKVKQNSGKFPLKVELLSQEFKTKKLFQNLSFEMFRGEKLAIIGENGIGKSTLLKTILGQIPPHAGVYTWGHEVNISYFSQDHHELLNTSISVLSWLESMVSNVSEQKARQVLNQVLFNKDDVNKDILALSGGEAARLLLAKIILEEANVLILDEPTNHLDIEATEALEQALKAYKGTLIFVSHERNFIKNIADRVLFLRHDKKVIDMRGAAIDLEFNE